MVSGGDVPADGQGAPGWTAVPEAASPAPAVGAPAAPAAQPFDERQYATFVHVSALAGLLIGFFFVGPLILWLVKKDRSAFVDRHGCAALNFHFSLLLYEVVAVLLFGLLGLLTLGIGFILLLPVIIVLALVAVVLQVVFPILGCMAANRGQEYRYPMSIPFLKPSVPAGWATGFTPA